MGGASGACEPGAGAEVDDEVGEALEHVLTRKLVERSELFICSKAWNNDHSAERVRAACLRSLKALRLEYLDLYMASLC